MHELTASPFFAIPLCLVAYLAGNWLHKKTGSSLANPLAIAVLLIIAVLLLFRIPVDSFEAGSEFIQLLLLPATACLAVKVYTQRDILMQNLLPILAGCISGGVVSVFSVVFLGRLFQLDPSLTQSALPKSATTPIAVEGSALVRGIPSLTVALVLVTGLTGALLGPVFIKVLRLKRPLSAGVAFGASSHAVGTSEALKLGNKQGAASSVSIVVTGLVIYLLLLFMR